jgi:hypothetical protein
MKPRFYNLIESCVTRAVPYGLRRAHKHIDDPTDDQIASAISNAVMSELCEFFNFDESL